MIFTERQITVHKGKSSIDESVILYRGDHEVSIKFTIIQSKFRFKSGVNLVDSEKASHGQLAILAPYGGNVFSEIVRCEDGTVTFTLTKEMIDQLEEVGLYSFQIRLFDYYRESRVSIPPVEFGIEVREPVASEDHDNEVNNAIVGYSIAKVVDGLNEDVVPTFDIEGQYNKTDWMTGDRISEGKLNKIEDAIDKINQNEINDKNALNKQMTSNFNVLQNQLDNLILESGNTDVEVEQARGEYSLLNQRLNAMDEIDEEFASQLARIENVITLNALDFGAKGDGKTDDTQAIKSMCEFVNERGYGNIVFPKGDYIVSIEDREDYWFNNFARIAHFSGCSNVNIDLGGSTFTVKGTKSPFYTLFSFGSCGYFEIKNGKLIGDRLTHDYAEYRGTKSHEWGYGVSSIGSNGTVVTLEISQFTGDGINSEDKYRQISGGFETLSKAFIEVDNCKIHHCRRQGITIGESDGGIIKNTHIHHIGDFDGITGTDPRSGIDIELELGTSYCDSVVIDNVTINDCSNFCIVSAISGDVINKFLLTNSYINGRIILSTVKTVIVSNTTFNFKYMNGITSCRYLTFNNCKMHIKDSIQLNDVILNDCYITGEYDEAAGHGSSINSDEDKITFNNCIIKDLLGNSEGYSWPSKLAGKPLLGFNIYNYGGEFTFNNCDISNCSCIMKISHTKPLKFNNSTIKNCYFMHSNTNEFMVQYNNCNIENLCGYYGPDAKYLFRNCNIKDDGTLPSPFVGLGLSVLYNCSAEITKTSTTQENYAIEAYNSYLNYNVPSDAIFRKTKLYNCCFGCTMPESAFSGTKINTTYIEK